MSAHTDQTPAQIRAALHGLGATHLVWDALPDDEESPLGSPDTLRSAEHDDNGRCAPHGQQADHGLLEIDGLHLEDATGTTVGWFAQFCEDGAYDLADAISDEPGTYVLSLPDGAWSHIITGYRDPDDPRYLNLDSEEN